MLTSLHIQGLAIIETLAIEFGAGFNVITGETGAGKSILIKALNFLLGAKATTESVRRGREAATVSGQFVLSRSHRAVSVIEHLGIPLEGEGSEVPLIIRRSLTNKGRSQTWINDVPVTIAAMRDLADVLIDVFTQHENQRILDPTQHTHYVDQFLTNKRLLAEYAASYDLCQTDVKNLEEMVAAFRAKQRDFDYLQFRRDELKQFAPSLEDYENTLHFCERGDRFQTLAGSLQRAQAMLDEGSGGESLSKSVREIARILTHAGQVDPQLAALADEAASIGARLDDLSYGLGRSVSGEEVDERELEAAQTRLAEYQTLFRKLAVSDIAGLLAEWERLTQELEFLESAATSAGEILLRLTSSVQTAAAGAKALSAARLKAAHQVSKRVEGELKALAMPGAKLSVEFSPAKRSLVGVDLGIFGDRFADAWNGILAILSGLSSQGAEHAHFLLASNPGETALPLQKIASGGEVSRIMLALKKALAAGADTCILVFDEIDTGISGRVADMVGQKLSELAEEFQVICISHLPQVAAYADTHFLVHKFGRDARTESTISRLSPKESAEEIARLLSGPEISPSSLANAKNLIERAKTRPSGSI